MSDRWDFYLANVNDEPASIFVNLGIRDEVPDRNRHWLLWVWVYMLDPKPSGLSSSEESTVLFDLEDHLISRVVREMDAKFVGRITTQGRREFYLYASDPLHNEQMLVNALEAFPEYRFDWGVEEDPGWQQYLTVLYPSERNMQRIKNRRVLEVLEERGDQPDQLREVRHWAYFKETENREAFISEAQNLGFSLVSESTSNEGENRYGVCVARRERADQESIDSVVLDLFELAKAHTGEYDGWETEVVRKIN